MSRPSALLVLILFAAMFGLAGDRAQQSPPSADDAWKNAPKIEIAALVKKIAEPEASRPVVLQVGFKALYDTAHIPGARYAGPGSTSDGLAALKKEVQAIPRYKEVVIYCGCCPMFKCPNVRPAYEALREMRFKQLEVLNIPQDFAHDWVDKHYPVEKGH